MDELTAALAILADKLRVDVTELGQRLVLYTRIIAVIELVICLIGVYLAYKVIDYIYQQFIKNDMFLGGLKARLKLSRDDYEKARWTATIEAVQKDLKEGAKIVRVVLMVLIMGAFAFGALRQIPTLVAPEGEAIENVLDDVKDATKVEIVQPSSQRERDPNVTVTVNNKKETK